MAGGNEDYDHNPQVEDDGQYAPDKLLAIRCAGPVLGGRGLAKIGPSCGPS